MVGDTWLILGFRDYHLTGAEVMLSSSPGTWEEALHYKEETVKHARDPSCPLVLAAC